MSVVLCIGTNTGSGAAPQPEGSGGAEFPQPQQILTDFIYLKSIIREIGRILYSPAILLGVVLIEVRSC